jgi:uncharacterized protein
MKCLFLLLLLLPLPLQANSPLRDHLSPYLAQHADDPVQWQLWSQDTLKRARRENQLIFVSSGYFACHWCHVMQRETFQNKHIADLLNRHVVAIKLDRELRPDLDAYLFEFVEHTHGIAGWPLNVFLTPDGQPLLGRVYLPADDFLHVLEALLTRWQQDAETLTQLARQAALPGGDDPAPLNTAARQALRDSLQQQLLSALRRDGDFLSGGIGATSKFPRVPILALLLEHFHTHPEMADLLHLTLDQMMNLGLRDHLGGGFSAIPSIPTGNSHTLKRCSMTMLSLPGSIFAPAACWMRPATVRSGAKHWRSCCAICGTRKAVC